MSNPTLIPQSTSIQDASIQRTLAIYPQDGDGDVLVAVTEGEEECGLYLDANGVKVLLSALSSPTVERDSIPDPDNPDWNETAIAAAILFEKAIEFAYDKGSGVIETRKLFPKVSYAAPNGIVVTGDDLDRNDVRAFRVDRIQGEVKVL